MPEVETGCGDLTSAFDFSKSVTAAPTLPSTTAYQPPDSSRHPDHVPSPPTRQLMPKQERGRPSTSDPSSGADGRRRTRD